MKSLLKIPYYLLVAGVGLVGLLLLATMVPVPGNFKVKIVKSGSMEPAIMTGGIVVIRPETSYKVGEVITFGADTKTQIPTTHRIVEIKGEGSNKILTTKGDANDAPDPTQTKLSDVRGKVIFSLPYVGYILDFARKPLGFSLLVGIPALLVILDELNKIYQEIRRMRGGKKRNIQQDVRSKNVLDLRVHKPQENSYFSFKTFVAFLLVLGPLIGISSVGSTVSYYHENETSTGNTLQARADYGNNPVKVLDVPVTALAEVSEEEITATTTEEIIENTEATTTPEIVPETTPEVVPEVVE